MENSQNNLPLVSVLVPIYNVERYLGQCLDSLVGQTYPALEIIAINDGSTDGSLALLKEYAARDQRIRIIHKANSGYGDSMNQGLAAATGKYVGIVEPDDFASLNMYEEYVAAAEAFGADVVKSNYYEHRENSVGADAPSNNSAAMAAATNANNAHEEFVPETMAAATNANDAHVEFVAEAMASVVTSTDTPTDLFGPMQAPTLRPINPADHPTLLLSRPAIWSGLYRREFLLAAGIKFLPTPGAAYQDTSFAAKAWMAARTAVILPQPYLHYRVDSEGSSSNTAGKAMAIFGEIESTFDFLRDAEESAFAFVAEAMASDEAGCSAAPAAAFGPALGVMAFGSVVWHFNRIRPSDRLKFARLWQAQVAQSLAAGHLDLQLLQRPALEYLALLLASPERLVQEYDQLPWQDYNHVAYQQASVPVQGRKALAKQLLRAIIKTS